MYLRWSVNNNPPTSWLKLNFINRALKKTTEQQATSKTPYLYFILERSLQRRQQKYVFINKNLCVDCVTVSHRCRWSERIRLSTPEKGRTALCPADRQTETQTGWTLGRLLGIMVIDDYHFIVQFCVNQTECVPFLPTEPLRPFTFSLSVLMKSWKRMKRTWKWEICVFIRGTAPSTTDQMFVEGSALINKDWSWRCLEIKSCWVLLNPWSLPSTSKSKASRISFEYTFILLPMFI